MRIIAGTHRGRRFSAPPGMSTRPTTDRVREALFAVLGPIDGLNVADCYAGSGALGLEALSRGAAHVIFIESDRTASNVLRANITRLGFDERCVVIAKPVERCASALGGLDLVLSDPPWPIAAQAAAVVQRITDSSLTADGRLVLGHPKRLTPAPIALPGFELIQTRAWGDSAFSIFERSRDRTVDRSS